MAELVHCELSDRVGYLPAEEIICDVSIVEGTEIFSVDLLAKNGKETRI